MKIKTKVALAILGAGLLSGAASSSWAASSIGLHFLGRNANTHIAPTESAGVVPQQYWNEVDGNAFSVDGLHFLSSLPLLDNSGNATAVTLNYACSDSWSSDGGATTADERLMKGIIKCNPNPDAAPETNTEVMTFIITNLPASSTYNVLVYMTENGTGAEADCNIGSNFADFLVEQTNVFHGTDYIAVPVNTTGEYLVGNYARADSVPVAADGTISIIITKAIAASQVNDGAGCCAIQLIRVTGGAFPPNTATTSITNQPSSVTNIAGVSASFSVGTSGPHRTQWQRNSVAIPGAVDDSYTTPILAIGNAGDQYTAVVFNNVITNTSTPAITYLYVNTNGVALTADPVSTLVVAGQTASFSVSHSGPLVQVQWQRNTVDIPNATNDTYTTPATVVGDNGTTFRAVIHNNVNTITSAAATLYVDPNTPAQLTQGYVKVARYENIGNAGGFAGVMDTVTAAAAGPATATYYVAGADVPQTSPDLSNFGSIASGWVKPDVTGDYTFFIRSDDSSALWLNPVAAASGPNTLPNPATDAPVCEEDTCCRAFLEPVGQPFPTTDTAVHLEAGKLYGFVGIIKEIGGGDYLQIAWRLSTDTTAAASLHPISPANCYAMASPAGQRAVISSQPQSLTIQEGRFAKFNVGVSNFPSGTIPIIWLTNGVIVPGATGTSYKTPILQVGDSGLQVKARAFTLAGTLDSTVAVVTVIPDTFAPVPAAGAIVRNSDGVIEVGVSFDEPVNPADLVAGNFSVVGAASSTFRLAANTLGTYAGAVLDTTGLTPGSTYSVLVKNVRDVKGNAIPAAGVNASFTVGKGATAMGWADTGVPIAPGQVVPAGPGGFDILNGGRQEWNSYDEITMAYVKKTNNFDVKVQVIYAEPGSQWTRVGLQARNWLNAGEPSSDGLGGGTNASAYAQTHVNPTQTFASSGVWDPNDPTQPGNPTPNNGHEQNQRLAREAATTGWGNAGSVPNYPDVWLRLARQGTALHGYRSEDGVTWIDQGTTTLTDQQPDMFVGPFLAVETGNIWNSGIPQGTVWTSPYDPIYDRLFVAQFRNFSDTVSAVPTISIGVVGGRPTITFTGTLQSSPTVNGTYSNVSGATSPYSVPPGSSAGFFRSQ